MTRYGFHNLKSLIMRQQNVGDDTIKLTLWEGVGFSVSIRSTRWDFKSLDDAEAFYDKHLTEMAVEVARLALS